MMLATAPTSPSRGQHRIVAAIAALALVLIACGDAADGDTDTAGWPDDNIRWVVPASAGGGFDGVARTLQPALEDQLGTNLIMDNQPGADTALGTQVVADNGQDCQTILITGVPHVLYSYLTQDVTYEYERDLRPIGALQIQPAGLIVRNDAPWETLEELIDDAQARPGEIVVAAGQFTSNNYTGMLELTDATDTEFNQVTFGTGGDARTAILSGEGDVMHSPVFSALSVQDEVRFLAVHQDSNDWEDITNDAPTINEALGLDLAPNQSIYGLFAHAECVEEHPERFDTLVAALEAAMADDDYLERLESTGELSGMPSMSPDELHDQILADLDDVLRFIDERPELQRVGS